MAVALLLLAGVATVAVPDPDACAAAREDEIVVCKRAANPESFRLRPLPPAPATAAGPSRAEWGLGGGVRMGVEASSAALPQGAVSQRAMVKIKVPF